MLPKRHQTLKKLSKNSHEFYCADCDYYTSRKSDYKKHLKTRKHLEMASPNVTDLSPNSQETLKKVPNSAKKVYICEFCDKEYNSRNGLWRHKKKCKPVKEESSGDKIDAKLMEKVIDLMDKKLGNTYGDHNTINSNNTTNNISINVFLNEKCKNAPNLTDFVNQIKVQLEDVMYTKEHGSEKGITNILVKQLEDVPITERPIHCADRSRKKFYVKDDDEWKKTQPSKEITENKGEKGPIERCIRNLKTKQHLVMEEEWKEENPDHEINPQKKDEYLEIESQIWTGCAKGESWSDYMKKMEKDIAEWSLPTLKEEMKQELENKK